MNLIEQLGGYEEAKEWYKDQDLRGNHTTRIRADLLQYRRQHNIFEVGDFVTHLTTRDILRVIRVEDSIRHYRFVEVESVSPKNDGSISDRFSSLWFQLEHATDEEIKAGKRLEVDDEK